MAHGSDIKGKMVEHREVMLGEIISILEGKVTSLDGPRNSSPKYHLGVDITGDLCRGEHKVLEYDGRALDVHYGDNILAHVINGRSIFGRQAGKMETFSQLPMEKRLFVPALKIELLDESGRSVKTYGHIPEEIVRIFE